MTSLPLSSLFAFILMLPLLFGELMAASLGKLRLSPEMALLLMMAIIIGGFVNIPVKRIVHERVVPTHPLAIFSLGRALARDGPRAPRDDHCCQFRRLCRSERPRTL